MQSKGSRKCALPRAVWIALGLLCVLTRVGDALRMGPDPMIQQFLQGYGIVAAEVVQADHVVLDPKKRYPAYYDVTFRVREVVAPPIKGDPFPLKRGDTFVVRATMGYACAIEDMPASPHELGPARPV